MTYMPELRKSLVRAAERENAGAESESVDSTGATGSRRAPRREPALRVVRRPRFGALVTTLGAGIALSVVATAVLLSGHNGPTRPTVGGAPALPVPTAAEARRVAERIVGSLPLPPGAVPVKSDPTRPRQLGRTSELQGLGLPHVISAHRFWRVKQSPQQMLNWFDSHAPRGGGGSGSAGWLGSEAESAGGPTGRGVTSAGAEVGLGSAAGFGREIGILVVGLPRGGSAVRVDGMAAWPAPPPTAVKIPLAVDRLSVRPVSHASQPPVPDTIGVPTPVVRDVVALLNRLPRIAPGTEVPRCRGATPRLSLLFYSRGRRSPLAWVLLVSPPCRTLVQLEVLSGPRTSHMAVLRATGQQLSQLDRMLSPAR
jgi:hypothetical protein